MDTHALVYSAYGKPTEVLRWEGRALDDLRDDQVRVRLIASPIHPSDIGLIQGSYGTRRELPAVGGREGIGEIVACGSAVTGLKPGQRVRLPAEQGIWQTLHHVSATACLPLPRDVPDLQAAQAFINPVTALAILTECVPLEPGDWISLNAANSAVGLSFIRMARWMGFRTLAVIRRPDWEDSLKALGADAVVPDNDDWPGRVRELTGGQPVRLALNQVGGQSVYRLIKALGEGGTCVTIGAAASEAIRFPTRYLIFNDIRLIGFWLDAWLSRQSAGDIANLYARVFAWMAAGDLELPVADTFPLERYQAAFAALEEPRLGKVLFHVETTS
ncbi:MAG: zinc-dependent alcohol dehydrogenase family protein [Opitutales bacterium]